MKNCPNCKHANSIQAKFCNQCGSDLPAVCQNCGLLNKADYKFCTECGASIGSAEIRPTNLSEPVLINGERKSERLARAAERRQLTILFCDLIDSTALSERLDPEDYRQVILNYQHLAEKVIKRYGGYVAQYLGDGLLVYFGYPRGLEDAPRAGVRAGLGILEAVGHDNKKWAAAGQTTIQVRIGIHTGLVVVDEHLALGDAVNIAARLEALAPANGLVISPQTWKLIEGWFEVKSAGEHFLKGISRPMEVLQVLCESGARTRLEVAKGKGLSPMVGREKELQLLKEKWTQAKKKKGSLVLLKGEAGIGKSRLVDSIKEEVARQPDSWLTELICSYHQQNSAFFPIIALLENTILQYDREENAENKLHKLEGFLLQSGVNVETAMPVIAEFLSIPTQNSTVSTLTPLAKKQLLMKNLIQALLHRAAVQPVLLVVEDLHWADPSTVEWLNMLLDQLPAQAIFALCTTRPVDGSRLERDGADRPFITQVTLEPLAPEKVAAICRYQTKGKSLPKEILDQIIGKTGGVPLYIEELTKMVLESDLVTETKDQYELAPQYQSGSIPLTIPSTLQDSLLARLDSFSGVKEIVQLGAVLGREFPLTLINDILNLEAAELKAALSSLVEGELLYQIEIGDHTIYRFKHALIQDVAYESMLKSRRQQLHRRVADILKERSPDKIAPQPELLAYHYTEAGSLEEAIPYWKFAGQTAVKRSANVEAVNHFRNGISLLAKLPENEETLQQELELQTALGPALMATKGFASPEVREAYSRARTLCSKLKGTPSLFSTLWGLWYYYAVLPDEQMAHELGQQLLSLAGVAQDDTLKMIGHRALGAVKICQGDFAGGLDQLGKGLAIYNAEHHRPLAYVYGQDIGLICRQWSAIGHWMLGYPDQALEMSPETVRMAREGGHLPTLVYILHFTAQVYQFCRQGNQVTNLLKECIRLSDSHQIPIFFAAANILQARQMAEDGKLDAGLSQLRENLNGYRSTGAQLLTPYFLTLLAEVYGKLGQIDFGLDAVNEALAISEKGGEQMWNAEILRIKGELLLTKADQEAKAEQCFTGSLELARHQKAKSWELRTAISLSRLWHRQGKVQEARRLLQKSYDWFKEGFDTTDLQEANTLLLQLTKEMMISD